MPFNDLMAQLPPGVNPDASFATAALMEVAYAAPPPPAPAPAGWYMVCSSIGGSRENEGEAQPTIPHEWGPWQIPEQFKLIRKLKLL